MATEGAKRECRGKLTLTRGAAEGSRLFYRNHTPHFFKGSQPLLCMLKSIFMHEFETIGAGKRANSVRSPGIADGGAKGVVENENLVDADAPLVTGEIAVLATVGNESNFRGNCDPSLKELRCVFLGYRNLLVART